jgi:small subunit ribosomal protein S20
VATHKSAEKRARQNVKRAARNAAVKQKVRTALRGFREALTGPDASAKLEALKHATRELRRAASKGLFPKTTVSRRVSRLELAYNRASK